MADVTYRGMSWSSGDRTQWNFPGQTAASKCEGFHVFQELTPSLWSPQFWFYQTTSNTLKMGKESVPETSGKLHILTWLSAQKISLNKERAAIRCRVSGSYTGYACLGNSGKVSHIIQMN